MQEHARPSYEVVCHRCGVTFAIGTKKCIHCGSRLGRSKDRATIEMLPSGELVRQGEAPEIVIAEEESSGRSKLPFSPMTLLWVVIIAASIAQRTCQGG
jgi:ribosomal protein L40E